MNDEIVANTIIIDRCYMIETLHVPVIHNLV